MDDRVFKTIVKEHLALHADRFLDQLAYASDDDLVRFTLGPLDGQEGETVTLTAGEVRERLREIKASASSAL